MKSHTISGKNGKAEQFGGDCLSGIRCEVKANQTRLQAGCHGIKELLHCVALKTVPSGKSIGRSELLTVKLAYFAPCEAPLIGLVEVIALQNEQVWHDGADL